MLYNFYTGERVHEKGRDGQQATMVSKERHVGKATDKRISEEGRNLAGLHTFQKMLG